MAGTVFERRSGSLFWICFFPVFALSLWALWRYGFTRKDDEAQLSRGGFDIPEAPKQEEPLPAGGYASGPAAGGGLGTPVSPRPIGMIGSAAGAGAGGQTASPRDQAARQKELDFIRNYGPIVRGVDGRIQDSIQKHWKKHPVLSQFASDYSRMTRLRGAYRQYAQDGDFYQYVRTASALPETKQLINKYVGRPDAWKAGFAVALDVLKNPPPAAVYGELLKTVTSDRVASKNTTDLMMPILSNLPAMSLQAAVPGSDMKLINGLVSDATGGSSDPKVPLVNSQSTNSYWAGYQKGYEDGLHHK